MIRRWKGLTNGRKGFANMQLIPSTPNHIRHSKTRLNWTSESRRGWLDDFKTKLNHRSDCGTTWLTCVPGFDHSSLAHIRTSMGGVPSNKCTVGHLIYHCTSCMVGTMSWPPLTMITNGSWRVGLDQPKIMVGATLSSSFLSLPSRSFAVQFGR